MFFWFLIIKFITQPTFLFEVFGFYYPLSRQNRILYMGFSFFWINYDKCSFRCCLCNGFLTRKCHQTGIESLPQALISNPYIYSSKSISKYEWFVVSNNLSLKCQRCTLSGCKDIGIWLFDFVAKTCSSLVT